MKMEKMVDLLVALATTWGLKIVGALLGLFTAWMIAGWVRKSIVKASRQKLLDEAVVKFVANLARYTILVGATLGILGIFGVETASFAAVIGAVGLAIGLAFQGTLSNFASGVMLLIFRPFKVGDNIAAAGIEGTVQEIDLFTSELTSFDNRRIIIPNAAIFGSVIQNFSHFPTRRVDISVSVGCEADLDQTRSVLEAAVPSVPKVLADPPPQIVLKELTATSVAWQVRLWCNTGDYWDVYEIGLQEVKKAIDTAGIGIPFQSISVRIDDAAKLNISKR